MRLHLLILLLSFYETNIHGHASSSSSNEHAHISHKMEDYVHDMNHIQHDLQGQINKPVDQMTNEERNFYYFKLHDTNNDNQLDGLEVIAAFEHTHDDENVQNKSHDGQHNKTQTERLADDVLTSLVDDILKEEDLNRDGFISYGEFQHALQSDTA